MRSRWDLERRWKLASGLYREVYNERTQAWQLQKIPKRLRPLCGARTRAGGTCQARAVFGRARCRRHGGLSTGPKTPEGRARIAESNRRRARRRENGAV